MSDTGNTHTPGPWVSEATGQQPGAFSVVGDGRQLVALVYGENREAQKANAALIDAAPDLLEALEKLTERYVSIAGSGDCGFWNPEKESEVIAARAAIAKSTTTPETRKDGERS